MSQALQPVIDAVKRGDKPQAIALLKQILSNHPNDINALLALAAILDEPTRKRQVLNRVLSVSPTNKAARDMLLEMDRAEMRAYRSQPEPAPAFAAQPPPAAVSTPSVSVPPPKSSNPMAEKPLVFRPSTVWLVILYLFTAFFCGVGLLTVNQSIANSFVAWVAALVFGLTALSLSSKVELTSSGVRSSTLLGSSEIKWNEIASLKSNSTRKKLELSSSKGKTVRISTQVKDYPAVIEILRQKRPDLFGETRLATPQANPAAQGVERAMSAPKGNPPVFTGARTFRKHFFKQYGLLFLLIPFCLLFFWVSFAAEAEMKVAFLAIATFCALLTLVPFFQVSGLKVEPDKLTIQTFFEEKEFSARQIKDIKMQSIHGRYGRVTNIVNIIPLQGKSYPLGGFSDGEEIIYGFLMNWWAKNQNT